MEKLIIFIKFSQRFRRGIYVIGGMFIIASHNIINPRYAYTGITHFYTFMEKGPRVRNIKTVRLFPL